MIVSSIVLDSLSTSLLIPISSELIDKLDNKIRLDLQVFSDSWFLWVWLSALVVAVGCALEGPELLHELWPNIFIIFSGKWVKKLGLVGWLLVVLGVTGEGIFEVVEYQAVGLFQTFNNILLADAQKSAGIAKISAQEAVASALQAKALATGARGEADTFEARIVSADTNAAKAERDLGDALRQVVSLTEELKRLKSPRMLTNAAEFSTALRKFTGTEYTFSSVNADAESIDLLKQIDTALSLAGWKRVKPSPPPSVSLPVFGKDVDFSVGVGASSGIEVAVESTETVDELRKTDRQRWPTSLKIAEALRSELAARVNPAEGNVRKEISVDAGTSIVIRVGVGKKP